MTAPTHGQPANPGAPITKKRGANLPHWSAQGSVYSLSFRLGDSVPAETAYFWRKEREHLVARAAALGRELTPQEQDRLAALYSERIEAYLDAGHGACHLRDPRIAGLVRGALLHFDLQRYDLIAWCIMPNHVHTVTRPFEGHSLPAILHSWKGYSAGEANKLLGHKGEFWQAESYDHLIRDEDDLRHAVSYVLHNPEGAGLNRWPWVGVKHEWMERLGLNGVARASLPVSECNRPPS